MTENNIELTAKGIKKATACEPIKDLADIEKIKNLLNNKKQRRYYVLFCTCLNSACRISDALRLTVADIKTGMVKMHEQKTNKFRTFPINPSLKAVLDNYIAEFNLKDDEYLFHKSNNRHEHIKRSIAYRTIVTAINTVLPNLSAGTHVMRKTFSWHIYQRTKDLGLLCTLLNHSSITATRHYLGLTQDSVNEVINNLNL